MKRFITAMICLCIILSLLLSSCLKESGGGDETDSTTENTTGETVATTTTAATTSGTTEYDYSKIPDVIEPHESQSVAAGELGLDAFLVSTDKYYVANAVIEESGDITVTSYNPGTAAIKVKNNYGEAAILTVKVALDYSIESIDIDKFEMPQNYVNAKDYGLDEANEDNSEQLQAAINALPNGGVVYIPHGRYPTKYVELKSNVALRLEGILPDYNVEYSDEIASLISGGEFFAVLASAGGDMFVNTPNLGAGRNGADNLEITGGVIDMEGRSRAFIWACADGVLLENVIMKDCPNDHAIQITGSKNVTIRDVLFAGYNFVSNTTGSELIQIETSHPGATGAAEWAPAQFETNEFYNSENVRIENCYFGKSDEYDSATYFIGHHGHQGGASLTGFKVLGCTFDNPRVVAIRAYAYVDVEIADCKFISDRDNSVVANQQRYMIEMNFNSGDVKLSSGVYLFNSEARGGCRDYKIHDNDFVLGESSALAGFIKTLNTGTTWCDAKAYSSIIETDFYTETPHVFTGYKMVTTCVADISISNNTFTVKNSVSDTLFHMYSVRGLEFKNNVFDASGTHVKHNLDGVMCYGASFLGSQSMRERERTFRIACVYNNKTVPIVLQSANGNIEAYCTGTNSQTNYILTVSCGEGGVIERYATDDGKLYVKVVADDGYVFDGYYVGGVKQGSGRLEFSASTTVTAVFVQK
ncbi:MAG: hypothetical protein IJV72_00420 [Clostridia bacterium]|nr:hypothetical protein [Clostridia bacterium]